MWVSLSTPLQATSIRQLSFDELVGASVMVFEGEVLSNRSRYNPAGTAIVTEVTFRIFDILKGDYSGSELQLWFAGGQVDTASMVIPDMHYPKPGERGVYFVKTLEPTRANPLAGWSQGHFVVRRDAGLSVSTVDGQSVYEVKSIPASIRALSTGTAAGISTAPASPGDAPLTLDQFKAKVRARSGR